MLQVGLTGGAGCGKSEALKILAASGCEIHDCDRIARELVEPGRPAYREILKAFGPGIRRADGGIDRDRLRKVILGDSKKADRLEKILHPRIRRRMRQILKERERRLGVVVIEVPLLFETGAEKLFDTTVAVTAPWKKRQSWVKRRGWTGRELRRVAARQWPLAQKKRHADHAIRNEGSLKALETQVVKWLGRIRT